MTLGPSFLTIPLAHRGLHDRANGVIENSMGAVKAAIAAAPDCAGLLVMACDQPGVDDKALAALVRAWRQTPRQPAAAAYAGILGIPAILPMPRARSLSLSPDRGAQASLMNWPGGSTAVPMAAAGFDVDTPMDLARLAPGNHEQDGDP